MVMNAVTNVHVDYNLHLLYDFTTKRETLSVKLIIWPESGYTKSSADEKCDSPCLTAGVST
jgi:hypothetical protein